MMTLQFHYITQLKIRLVNSRRFGEMKILSLTILHLYEWAVLDKPLSIWPWLKKSSSQVVLQVCWWPAGAEGEGVPRPRQTRAQYYTLRGTAIITQKTWWSRTMHVTVACDGTLAGRERMRGDAPKIKSLKAFFISGNCGHWVRRSWSHSNPWSWGFRQGWVSSGKIQCVPFSRLKYVITADRRGLDVTIVDDSKLSVFGRADSRDK